MLLQPQLVMSMANIKDVTLATNITNAINDTLVKYNINTPLRVCHFLAQVLHESGNFQFLSENLNYSDKALLAVFPKYFPTEEVALQYARNPQKIANKVYANRMGNGDEASGDGFKYKGRGYIQVTGKINYTLLTNDLGVDFIKTPEQLENIKYAAISAGWFWYKHNLNLFADKDDVLTVTKIINGGINGLDDRKAKLVFLKNMIK